MCSFISWQFFCSRYIFIIQLAAEPGEGRRCDDSDKWDPAKGIGFCRDPLHHSCGGAFPENDKSIHHDLCGHILSGRRLLVAVWNCLSDSENRRYLEERAGPEKCSRVQWVYPSDVSAVSLLSHKYPDVERVTCRHTVSV